VAAQMAMTAQNSFNGAVKHYMPTRTEEEFNILIFE